jgi:hypothetical protein
MQHVRSYKLDGRTPTRGKGKIFFSLPQSSDRFRRPPSLLYNVYREFFPGECSGPKVKLTSHLHLVPRSRMLKPYLHSPIFLHNSLTHGAEPFLRSCQLCSHSRNSQHFMEPEGYFFITWCLINKTHGHFYLCVCRGYYLLFP